MKLTDSRLVTICLVLLGVILTAGLLADRFLLVAAMLAASSVLFMTAGSPIRVVSLILAVQIVFTIAQLTMTQIFVGFFSVRVDDLLSIWLIWLWLLSLPDRSMRGIRYGVTGFWIGLFLVLAGYSAYSGLTTGNDAQFVGEQLKTFGGYLFYFPMLWVLSRKEAWRTLWRVLLTSAVISGFIFMLKGVTGAGEGVYYRMQTGLRIGTRQPNAIGAVMLLFLGRLWKDWRHHPPLALTVPSLAVMGGALILSQTRGLWGGVLLALASAWILNLFRKESGTRLGKKLVLSLTVLAVTVVMVVMVVSGLGILSAADIAERTGSESGNYITDTAILSRILSWLAVADRLDGAHLLMGRGMGATITYFKPEFGEMRTMFFVDSSYFQTALIMGVTGVVALLMIWFSALVRAARLFLRTKENGRAGIALGLFCAVIMLMFASGFASPLTNYRFSILWVFLLALLQTEINRDRESLLSGKV